jgi:ribosomal protein S18 acetylase RimI-like enzyme
MFALGPLHASQRGALLDLLRATGAFSPDEVAVAIALFDETVVAPGTGAPDYEFVGAFDASRVIAGYCCYGPTPGTEGTYDVYWIAVNPAHQRGGVGSMLLHEVERRLTGRGARLLVVETSGRSAYDATRRFYGARGYRVAARLHDFYGPADDRLVFTRELGGSPSPAARGV